MDFGQDKEINNVAVCPMSQPKLQRAASAEAAITTLQNYQQGKWVTEWPLNTLQWFRDLYQSGGLKFLENHLKMPNDSGDGYYAFRKVPLLHRTAIYVFTDPKLWAPLFGHRKGTCVRGGVELDKLKPVVSEHTPLTIDNVEEHSKIKRCCMHGNFNVDSINHTLQEIFNSAELFFQHSCLNQNANKTVDFTFLARQYVSRTNTMALLAPKGSKSLTMIRNIFYKDDGSPNPEWNPVPEAIENLGNVVNKRIVYDPTQLLADPSVEEGWKGTVDSAVEMLIAKSLQAHEMEENSAIKGQIERMIAENYTKEEIDGMTRLILFIGQRTTSVALEACIRHLVLYPEWQDKLYQEIQTIKSVDGNLKIDQITTLSNLDNFIWETLRLFPPVPVQTREATKDLEYNNLKIEKGATMMMLHYLIQRDPNRYQNPDQFNPDRFFDKKNCNKNEMYTFSRYPHNCAGKNLAVPAIKCALIKLVLSCRIVPFDVRKVEETKPFGGFILKFEKPLEAICVPRQSEKL